MGQQKTFYSRLLESMENMRQNGYEQVCALGLYIDEAGIRMGDRQVTLSPVKDGKSLLLKIKNEKKTAAVPEKVEDAVSRKMMPYCPQDWQFVQPLCLKNHRADGRTFQEAFAQQMAACAAWLQLEQKAKEKQGILFLVNCPEHPAWTREMERYEACLQGALGASKGRQVLLVPSRDVLTDFRSYGYCMEICVRRTWSEFLICKDGNQYAAHAVSFGTEYLQAESSGAEHLRERNFGAKRPLDGESSFVYRRNRFMKNSFYVWEERRCRSWAEEFISICQEIAGAYPEFQQIHLLCTDKKNSGAVLNAAQKAFPSSVVKQVVENPADRLLNALRPKMRRRADQGDAFFYW